MKNQKIERQRLYKALFEDKDFSTEQLQKANETLQKNSYSKKEQKKFKKIQELQYRVNARRNELVGKSLGTDKPLEDQDLKSLVDELKKSYEEFKNISCESEKLSLDLCPELPKIKDFMSRIHKGENNNFSPLSTRNSKEIIGTDDFDHISGIEDMVEANAEAEGGVFHVSATSNDDGGLYGGGHVEARSSLFFPLITGYAPQNSDLVVKAYMYGRFEGSIGPSDLFSDGYARAWIQMNLNIWNGNHWRRLDSATINLLDLENSNDRVSLTSFEKSIKLSSELPIFARGTNGTNITYQVSITSGVEALNHGILSSILFGTPPYSVGFTSAHAWLSMVMCALDIGFIPRTRFPYEEREIQSYDRI